MFFYKIRQKSICHVMKIKEQFFYLTIQKFPGIVEVRAAMSLSAIYFTRLFCKRCLRHEARAIAARSLRCWNPARSLEHLERWSCFDLANRSRNPRVERSAWSTRGREEARASVKVHAYSYRGGDAKYSVPSARSHDPRLIQRCLMVARVKVA